jgi:ectoine hydroxylase-related dioxygenase (phytanoyl-CoA dioxygenase family)
MTLLARGSHLISTPLPVTNGQPAAHTVVQPPMRRGDVCLFENRIFHTGSVNMTDAMSKCIIIGYSYRYALQTPLYHCELILCGWPADGWGGGVPTWSWSGPRWISCRVATQ